MPQRFQASSARIEFDQYHTLENYVRLRLPVFLFPFKVGCAEGGGLASEGTLMAGRGRVCTRCAPLPLLHFWKENTFALNGHRVLLSLK